MKIQIVNTAEPTIGGYERVDINDNQVDLSKYSDNECEFILASDVLDYFPISDMGKLVQYIVSKLRLNGTIVIGGTYLNILCKNVINSMMSIDDASNMIGGRRSMSSPDHAINALQAAGLKVHTSQISGIHYEVTAVRGGNS